ncbi:MAG: hypothetical protein IJ386_00330 [Clostridia bacterium]|nr:hypothetical protein [Clostridia bacterium]
MSKSKYVEPELNIIAFEAADIVTTSADPFDGEYVPIGGRSVDENNDFLIE